MIRTKRLVFGVRRIWNGTEYRPTIVFRWKGEHVRIWQRAL